MARRFDSDSDSDDEEYERRLRRIERMQAPVIKERKKIARKSNKIEMKQYQKKYKRKRNAIVDESRFLPSGAPSPPVPSGSILKKKNSDPVSEWKEIILSQLEELNEVRKQRGLGKMNIFQYQDTVNDLTYAIPTDYRWTVRDYFLNSDQFFEDIIEPPAPSDDRRDGTNDQQEPRFPDPVRQG